MIRCLVYAFTAIFKSRTSLVAENLCLRQQLIVLKRRQARPQLRDADRRFWILACQLFSGWSRSLIVVKPDTVVSWHRKGIDKLTYRRGLAPLDRCLNAQYVDASAHCECFFNRNTREYPTFGSPNSLTCQYPRLDLTSVR